MLTARLAAGTLVAALLVGCGIAQPSAQPSRQPTRSGQSSVTTTPSATPTPTRSHKPTSKAKPVRVVAVGDVACAPGDRRRLPCRDRQTADLARSLAPQLVLSLGDQQYQSGSYGDFLSSYDRSWGALKSITRPIPGNHEYKSSGAQGYYRYFAGQQPGAPGYYSFRAGPWRIYALNSNCDQIDCQRETAWLRAQFSRHQQGCSAVLMHHPLFTSGRHGPQAGMEPLWQAAYAAGNDLVLSGHDHTYERFAPLTPQGRVNPARGMRSFVVGTGGKDLYALKRRLPGSEFFQNRAFGVLDLRLRATGFTWRFVATDGRVLDHGRARCH